MSCHDSEGVIPVLCTPLQVKCYPIFTQKVLISQLITKKPYHIELNVTFSCKKTYTNNICLSARYIKTAVSAEEMSETRNGGPEGSCLVLEMRKASSRQQKSITEANL